MDKTSRLYTCNCFAVRKAARYIAKIYDHHLSQVGLTNAQFSILVALRDQPQSTIQQLGHALDMDRTSLVRALQPLQRDDFLQVSQSAKNARQYVYALSEQGEQKLQAAGPYWQQAQQDFEQRFGTDQAKQLREMALLVGDDH